MFVSWWEGGFDESMRLCAADGGWETVDDAMGGRYTKDTSSFLRCEKAMGMDPARWDD